MKKNKWKEYKLIEITEPIKNGYNPSGSDNLNYIGLEHIEQETLRLNSIGHSTDVTSNKFKFKKNDILFGKLRPYFRKVIMPRFDGICSTDIWVFRAKKDFDQVFLYYFLANWNFVNTANGGENGTRMPRADWAFLKNTVWKIPSFDEQINIAKVLKSFDNKTDLLIRQNKTLEELASTLFRQWFVEKSDKKWEVGKLEDILETIESGSRPKGGIDMELQKGIPSIGAENINGIGVYDFSKTRFITPDFYEKMNRGSIKDYDVLIYKDGAYVGRKGMFGNGFPYEVCTVNEHVFILRANKRATQFFLYFLLKQDDLEQLNTNSAQPGLNQESMKSLEVIIPPIELLHKFQQTVKNLIDKILFNSTQIRILDQLRDTLLPKLMSGEITIKQ